MQSAGGPHVFALRVALRQVPALDRLTEAERSVLLRLSRGGSNEDVARARGVSVYTLCNQVASIFEKLGVHCRAELALLLADADLRAHGVLHSSASRRESWEHVPRVLVAEDNVALLEELALDLEAAGAIVERASAAAEVRAALAGARFDAAVLDIRLGDESAIDLLRGGEPPCPVVLLSSVAEIDEAIEGLLLGAHEFVEKSAGSEMLRVAVGDAIASGPPLSSGTPPELAPTIVEPGEQARELVDALIGGRLRFVGTLDYGGARHHLFGPHVGGVPLSARQRAIVARVLDACSLKQIAAELEISEATVWTHLGRALDALGMRDRASLTSIVAPIAHLWPSEAT